jgi:antitoxin HicB
MNFLYFAHLQPDPDGGFLVTFPDVPEAITHGVTRQKALMNGAEALGLALRGYLADGNPLPRPLCETGVEVAVNAADAIKLAVIESFQKSGLSKSELARLLGKAEGEARRILDPDHPTKIAMMQEALRAMGWTIVISIMDCAGYEAADLEPDMHSSPGQNQTDMLPRHD